MDRRFDPRSIVTPYAFSVHPDLLGMPLASPWQRLGAILVDLLVIGLIYLALSLSGLVGLVLGLFSALLLFWLAFRRPGSHSRGKMFRFAVGCLGAVVLVITILIVLVIRFREPIRDVAQEVIAGLEEEGVAVNLQVDEEGLDPQSEASIEGLGFLEGVTALGEVMALSRATNEEEAVEAARALAQMGLDAGLSVTEIRTSVEGLIPEDAPWAGTAGEIVEEALVSLSATSRVHEAGEGTTSSEEAPVWLSTSEAADSVSALEDRIQSLERDVQINETALAETRRQLAEAEDRGVLDWLWSLIDDLGLGFGWAALYMTITHATWRGTSVGKKLFGLRVVMIDKRPLNWWLSFERVGGYAAGFATGMLGFAQVFWDPNRQGIHDKVSETIVIKDGENPVPGPWIAEGKAQWDSGRTGVPD
ncbi:RDD family protein [Gemmatimonadota bacterium]